MSKEPYKPAYIREKKARKSAEKILEEKSLELYELNQKLIKSNELLEKRVQERTEELLESKLRAEKLAKIKENFLSMMSHEMRTPLNGILGYTSLLLDEKLNEEQHDYLLRISYSGEVLLSIINDVLANSRIDADKEIVREVKFNLKDELDGLFKVFDKYRERKEIDYIKSFDSDLNKVIVTDLPKLKQILINLIGNAIKFTDEGSVHVKASLKNQLLKIEIIDTGIGIKKEDQKNIFHEFVQAEVEQSYKYSGTGLGLSITKKLVELLGGRISLESKWQAGSTFVVELPVREISEDIDHLTKTKKPFTVKKQRVLVVDDNKLNRDLLERILKKHVEVEVAEGADECLSLLKESDFELIFMDLRMPDVDGFELSKKIKDQYNFKGKIVLLTAEPLHSENDSKLINFFDGFVAKPFKIAEVLKFIEA